MKTLALIFALTAIFMMACKKDEPLKDGSSVDQTTTVKNIDGFKNGKPFINYLGAEMDGC